MFGTFRYLLAGMVVLTHLWPAQTMWWGVYAVFCFYLVSGYLMTLVLDRSYPYTADGMARYATNRVLRIYPPYVVVCLIALLLIYFLPDVAESTNYKLRWPGSIREWLSAFFIFGQLGSHHALVPPAWSLNIELVYYVAMAVLLSRNETIVTLWFVASCAYTAFLVVIAPGNFEARYSAIPGASLPFAFGALLYTYRAQLRWIPAWIAPISALLFVGNAALAAYAPLGPPGILHYYLSLFFGGVLLTVLARLRPADVPGGRGARPTGRRPLVPDLPLSLPRRGAGRLARLRGSPAERRPRPLGGQLRADQPGRLWPLPGRRPERRSGPRPRAQPRLVARRRARDRTTGIARLDLAIRPRSRAATRDPKSGLHPWAASADEIPRWRPSGRPGGPGGSAAPEEPWSRSTWQRGRSP